MYDSHNLPDPPFEALSLESSSLHPPSSTPLDFFNLIDILETTKDKWLFYMIHILPRALRNTDMI